MAPNLSPLSPFADPYAEPIVDLDDVREIAIVRALALGDLLCAVPALRSIRDRFPAARITLIGRPWARELVDRFRGYLDDHADFPGFPGIREEPFDSARTLEGLRRLQARHFDLAIQLHGNGVASNAFTALLGARTTAGFFARSVVDSGPVAGLWIAYPEHGHESRRLLRLAAALGGPGDDRPELPVRDADRVAVEETLGRLAPSGPGRGRGRALERGTYVVVHAGASEAAKRWPAARFAVVADHLARRGFEIVLTGIGADAAVTRAVAASMSAAALDLAGETSLGALIALVDGAALVVSNDTGVSHVASGVGTPSVVIFSASDPARWAPLDGYRHIALGGAPEVDGKVLESQAPSVAAVLAAVDEIRRRFPTGATSSAATRPIAAAR